MFYRWRRRLKTQRFDRRIAAIMDTPPLRIADAGWSVVSMVRNCDVAMYLLCLKAFYGHLGGGHVIGIVDRDMPQASRDLLRRHVEGIELVIREDIDVGVCQRGGTWERLVFLLDRAQSEYVIQMDSDVLAVGPDVHEVRDCIARNVAFTMSDGDRLLGMREAAMRAQADPDDGHVGVAVEQRFDRYPDCDRLRYVRGSSGLAGFARGGFPRSRIEEFHRIMAGQLPTRWHEWGSEQCGSNFAVANSPDAVVLPFPAYSSFGPGCTRAECKCFHFIGAFRFDDGYFAARGREVVQRMLRPPQVRSP